MLKNELSLFFKGVDRAENELLTYTYRNEKIVYR